MAQKTRDAIIVSTIIWVLAFPASTYADSITDVVKDCIANHKDLCPLPLEQTVNACKKAVQLVKASGYSMEDDDVKSCHFLFDTLKLSSDDLSVTLMDNPWRINIAKMPSMQAECFDIATGTKRSGFMNACK